MSWVAVPNREPGRRVRGAGWLALGIGGLAVYVVWRLARMLVAQSAATLVIAALGVVLGSVAIGWMVLRKRK